MKVIKWQVNDNTVHYSPAGLAVAHEHCHGHDDAHVDVQELRIAQIRVRL